jgi:hypothetical protein
MRILFTLLATMLISASAFSQNFISATYKGAKTKAQLNAQFGLPIFQYDVKYYKVTYTSNDAEGALDTLSGLVVVPTDLTKIYPLLVYQHGTSDCKTCVPSRYGSPGGGEGDVGTVFAGMGYITLMPDYVGMGDGRGFHPYVHAATEASAAIDMVRSAAGFIQQTANVPQKNSQIFITGYSQGGHAAMALHREMELNLANEFTVTAAAHLSGPYSISGVMRDLILSEEVYYYPAYIPNTSLSYQTMYDNLYDDLTDIFKPAYAGFIEQFYNGTITLSTLNEQLIQTLTAQTGASVARRMLQDSIVEAITNNPLHPINLALKDNDVYDWAPVTPTRIFYCMGDDQVPFENSVLARDTMIANGAVDLAATDVNTTADHGGCVAPAIIQTIGFFAGKQQISTVSSANEALSGLQITVAPNPASETLTVTNIPNGATVEMMDVHGKNVFRQTNVSGNALNINVGNLLPGVYWVQVGSGKGRLVLVQR